MLNHTKAAKQAITRRIRPERNPANWPMQLELGVDKDGKPTIVDMKPLPVILPVSRSKY